MVYNKEEIQKKIKENEVKIRERIKSNRTELNLTQEKLAELLNVSRKTLSQWENGITFPPHQDMLGMCEIFDCELGYLLCEHNCKTKKATDIQETTGLSEETITVLIRLHEHNNLKVKAIIEIINTLIESLRDNTEMWNLSQSIIAYMLNKHLNDLWRKKQEIKMDDSPFPLEDSQHDLAMYKVKGNFDNLIEYLLNVPKYKNRAEKILQTNFNYHKYVDEQFELERRIPIDISDGSIKTAISQTLALFFDDGYEEKSDIKIQLESSRLSVTDTPPVTECQSQTNQETPPSLTGILGIAKTSGDVFE